MLSCLTCGPNALMIILNSSNPSVMECPECKEKLTLTQAASGLIGIKRKKFDKPLAPVILFGQGKGVNREWLWQGEQTKDFTPNGIYYTTAILTAGFKLPKLAKKTKKEKK